MNSSTDRNVTITLCFGSARFFILFISILCLTLLMSNSVALNFTIICMNDKNQAENFRNTTIIRYDYSPLEKSWLFSIIAVGQIIGTIVLPYFVSKISIRVLLTIYGGISALSTLLTPISAYTGLVPLLFMRFLQGFTTSICFSSLGSITSKWSTLNELGMFISLLSTHYQLGYVFTMPLAGFFCDSNIGWPALYYLQGVMTILMFSLFYLFYRDDPYTHKFVGENELVKIERGKIANRQPSKVPYKAMFTDIVVWAVVLAITFVRCGSLLFVQYGPIYLNKVLHFDFKRTGISAALPFIGSILMKIAAGPLYDRVKCIPLRTNMKILVSISSFFLILGNIGLGFITIDKRVFAEVAFVLVISFSGLSFVGGLKTAHMISQHFSHVLMVVLTLFASFVHLILPFLVSILAPDNTPLQWRWIFIGISIIIFMGMLIYNLGADFEPRSWVKNSRIRNDKISHLSNVKIFSNVNKIEEI